MKRFLTLGLGLCCLMPLSVAAQGVADFYKGKQIQLRVGSAVGGGYDLAGRVIAAHINKYIPGNPNIIVQNVVGAGSLILTNQLANAAPKDGTVIGLVTNGMPTAPLLTPDQAKFDMSKFHWIGSPAPEAQIVMVWRTAPAMTLKDLFTVETTVGATAPGTAIYDVPVVMNALMGTKFKVISGYEGTAQIDLAMERGEVHGYGAQGWGSAKTRNMAQIQKGDMRILVQYGTKKHPDLPDVPLYDLPQNEVDRQGLLLMFSRQEFGRPLVFPEGVPADRVAALRKAFQDTMKDPAFRAEATKAGLEINPTSGEELEALNVQIMKTGPQAVERVRKLLTQ